MDIKLRVFLRFEKPLFKVFSGSTTNSNNV